MSERAVPAILEAHREEIRERFGVACLPVFGSAAREELTDETDVDRLVQFEGEATFDRFMGLKLYLEIRSTGRSTSSHRTLFRPR